MKKYITILLLSCVTVLAQTPPAPPGFTAPTVKKKFLSPKASEISASLGTPMTVVPSLIIPPGIVITNITVHDPYVTLKWQGAGNMKVQTSEDLTNWIDTEVSSSTGSAMVSKGGDIAYYRLRQLPSSGLWQWQQTVVNGNEVIVQGVVIDSSGNTYAVGKFRGAANFGGGSRTPVGGYDIFVVRYTSAGDYDWDKTVGGSDNDEADGVAVIGDDVIVTGGVITGPTITSIDFGNGQILTAVPTSSNQAEIFVAKWNTVGMCQWVKRFGSPFTDYGRCIATSSGKIVVGGSVGGSIDFGGGLRPLGGQSGFVLSLNAAGDYEWDKTFPYMSSFGLVTRGITIDSAGDVVSAGSISGASDFGNGPVTPPAPNSGFISKLTSTGAYVWAKTFGTASASGVDCDPSTKDPVITGLFRNGCDFGTGPLTTPGGGSAIFVVKYGQTDGATQWVMQYGGDVNMTDAGNSVAINASGRLFVTGQAQSVINWGDGFTFGNGLLNHFVLALETDSSFAWKWRSEGGVGQSIGRTADVSGSSIVTGGNFGGSCGFGGPVVGAGASQAAMTVSYQP